MAKKGDNSKYKKEFDEQAFKLCLLGHVDVEIADFFGVCEKTLNNWKRDHPSFLQSLIKGKAPADAEVAHSLYMRAKGYSHPEDKILSNPQDPVNPVVVPTVKHYAPDTGACALWLHNRQGGKWSTRPREVDTSIPDPIEVKESIVDAS